MYSIPPTAGECFYLLLLTETKGMLYELTLMKCFDLIYNSNTGAISFENLRTFEGHIHDTFKEACHARGLLEDDEEWLRCLQDASEMQTGQQL